MGCHIEEDSDYRHVQKNFRGCCVWRILRSYCVEKDTEDL